MRAPRRRAAVGWATALLLLPLPATAAEPGAPAPARRAAPVKKQRTLLYFHAPWCQGCRKFEAGQVLERLAAQFPTLSVERVDVSERPELLERHGVALTPTVLLVDERGARLGKLRLDLADPDVTLERGLALIRAHAP